MSEPPPASQEAGQGPSPERPQDLQAEHPRGGAGWAMAVVLAMLLLLVTLGAWAQVRALYPGLLLTEVGLLLVPGALACRRLGLPIPQGLGLTPPEGPGALGRLLAGAGIGLLAFGLAMGLTYPLVLALLALGGHHPGLPLPLDSPADLASGLLVGSALAAVCEEAFFRGFLLRGLAGLGSHRGVWLGAACFGVFHLDPVRFLPTFALGVVYGYLTVASGWIGPAVVAHGLNNALALSLGYLAGAGAGEPAATWEGLRQQVQSQLEAHASGPLAGDPARLADLALGVGAAAMLGGALALAGMLGLALRALGAGRRACPPLPGSPPPWRLPAAWGVAAIAAAAWALYLRAFFSPPAP